MAHPPLLRMEQVSKRFGPTHALRRVDLEVSAGQVLALIGENGAGKSTLMKILSGAIRADAGSMWLGGQVYAPDGPQAARRAGVAMIYQELTLAPDLSIEDNVMLGQEVGRWGLVRRGVQRQRVRAALGRLGHADLPLQMPVGGLSVGMQQIVEIARALVFDARLIVFDEPTSSLTRHDVRQLFHVIGRLRDEGMAVVYISHFLEEVREVCQQYAVLRDGQSVGAGQLAGATEAQIVNQMVGRSVDELFPTVPHEPGEVVLDVQQLSGRRLPTDVSFQLRRGEILGLAGLVGSGRTETLRTIFGLNAVRSGAVVLAGRNRAGSPRSRIAQGFGLLSEDRKGEGLAQSRSLADNITYSRMSPYSRWGCLSLMRRDRAVRKWLDRISVKARSPDVAVETLSGGNQQKVALARVLHQEADILLLDEPTRGIDVGTKAEIYRLIGELAAEGKAVVFVSSYLPELLAVCDRIAVMARGRLREIRPTSQWNEDQIMACAIRADDGDGI